MKHWTNKRRASLMVHLGFVSIPFSISTVSAVLFWKAMFKDILLAIPMVMVIDVLALAGMVLYIAKIESPFQRLRHLLPFISIVPLGRELYLLLQHNGDGVAWLLTIVVTAILVAIAWQCFVTIEKLFVNPVEAAREKAKEQITQLQIALATLQATNEDVSTFVVQYQALQVPMLPPPQMQYPRPQETDVTEYALQGISEAPQSTVETIAVSLDTSMENSVRVVQEGLSKSAYIREAKAKGKSVDAIVSETGWKRTTVAPIWSKA